jgi:hypothetical protein
LLSPGCGSMLYSNGGLSAEQTDADACDRASLGTVWYAGRVGGNIGHCRERHRTAVTGG